MNAGHHVITPTDFSHIVTPEQAQAAVDRGELEWFQLIPEQLGDHPAGRVPAPVGTTARLAPVYQLLEDMLRADLQVGLDLNIGYVGDEPGRRRRDRERSPAGRRRGDRDGPPALGYRQLTFPCGPSTLGDAHRCQNPPAPRRPARK